MRYYLIKSRDFAGKFVYIAGLRNFLAHDYQKDTTQELEKFLMYGIKDVEYFMEMAKNQL